MPDGLSFSGIGRATDKYKEMWVHEASQAMQSFGKEPIIEGKYAKEIEELKQIMVDLYLKWLLSEAVAYELLWVVMKSYYPEMKDEIQRRVHANIPTAIIAILSLTHGIGVKKGDDIVEFLRACKTLQGAKSISDIEERCRKCGQWRKDPVRRAKGEEPKCPIFNLPISFFDVVQPRPPNMFIWLHQERWHKGWFHTIYGDVGKTVARFFKAYHTKWENVTTEKLELEKYLSTSNFGRRINRLRLRMYRLAIIFSNT